MRAALFVFSIDSAGDTTRGSSQVEGYLPSFGLIVM
jgi:hypothetical protein